MWNNHQTCVATLQFPRIVSRVFYFTIIFPQIPASPNSRSFKTPIQKPRIAGKSQENPRNPRKLPRKSSKPGQGACCAGVVPMRAEDWSLGFFRSEVKSALGIQGNGESNGILPAKMVIFHGIWDLLRRVGSDNIAIHSN